MNIDEVEGAIRALLILVRQTNARIDVYGMPRSWGEALQRLETGSQWTVLEHGTSTVRIDTQRGGWLCVFIPTKASEVAA